MYRSLDDVFHVFVKKKLCRGVLFKGTPAILGFTPKSDAFAVVSFRLRANINRNPVPSQVRDSEGNTNQQCDLASVK